MQVHFLSCALYRLADACFPGGTVEILVEQELEGQYTKWWAVRSWHHVALFCLSC